MREPGTPPPDGAVVIREGKRRPPDDVVEDAADDAAEREDQANWDGNYRLSVAADLVQPGESIDDVVERVFAGVRRVKWYRVERVGALREAGFSLGASFPEPYHYDVVLGPTLDTTIASTFDDCFLADTRNQHWTSSR